MEMMHKKLFDKYNVPVPRYTSYPTVPDWQIEGFDSNSWLVALKKAAFQFGVKEGMSLYIHLPYCESLCTYCGCNTRITINHKVEEPYIDALLKELDIYIASIPELPKLKEVHLGGGTPTFFSPKNLAKLMEGIKSRLAILEDFEFSFEAHPNNTTREHLQILFDYGFKRLSLGVQDFDIHVQKAINRIQDFEQVKKVVDQARAIGYESVNLDVIYGLPFQKLCSVKDTMEKVLSLRPERIAYYSYAHVPWKHPGQRAYGVADLPSSVAKRNLYDFGKKVLIKNGYQEIGMDHFSLKSDALSIAQNQGVLHRNFMGYTAQKSDFLIGLGVSAISDVKLAYAQNAKTVEAYLLKINNHQLAHVKGHLMRRSDIHSKHLIQHLMCNKQLIKKELQAYLAEAVRKDFYKELEVMQKEGLLMEDENQYTVTTLGLKFIRNIAASLDPYQLNAKLNNRFSSSI